MLAKSVALSEGISLLVIGLIQYKDEGSEGTGDPAVVGTVGEVSNLCARFDSALEGGTTAFHFDGRVTHVVGDGGKRGLGVLHEGGGVLDHGRTVFALDEVGIYFYLERLRLLIHVVLAVEVLGTVSEGRCHQSAALGGDRGVGVVVVVGECLKLVDEYILIFLQILSQFGIVFLKFGAMVPNLNIGLLLFLQLLLHLFYTLLQLYLFLLLRPALGLPQFLRLVVIRMHDHVLLHLLDHLLRLPEFQHHPTHLHVKFGVDLTLHLLVHQLHKFLDYVLQVLRFDTLTQLLLETTVYALHVRRTTEVHSAPLETRTRLRLDRCLRLVDQPKHMQYETNHPVLPGKGHKIPGLDSLTSENVGHLVAKMLQDQVNVLVLPEVLVTLDHAIDEVLQGNGRVEIKVTLHELDGLRVRLTRLVLLIQQVAADDRGIIPTTGSVQHSTAAGSFQRLLPHAFLNCALQGHAEGRGGHSVLHPGRSD